MGEEGERRRRGRLDGCVGRRRRRRRKWRIRRMRRSKRWWWWWRRRRKRVQGYNTRRGEGAP